jgi:hypothetical protein
MSISTSTRLALGAVALCVLLVLPLGAAASMLGQCEAEAHTASGSSVSFSQDEWHIKKDDVAGGSGQSSSKMTKAQVGAYALGILLPITGGEAKPGDDGQTQGSVEGIAVSTYSVLGARFTVMAVATGPGAASCTGTLRIVLDDVNPALTLLGGGGILVAIVCLLIFLALARGGSGCLPRIVGGAFGLLGGCGAGLAAEQFGVIVATQPIGLVVAVASAVVGFLIPGVFGGGSGDAPTPTSTPTPSAPRSPAPSTTMTPEDYRNTATDVFTGGSQPVGGSDPGTPSGSQPGVTTGETYPPGAEGGGGPM